MSEQSDKRILQTGEQEFLIGETSGSVYSFVGQNSFSCIFDIEGLQFIDGGLESDGLSFLKKFKNTNGIFISAPTSNNLKSCAELENIPVISNLKGGTTPQLKKLSSRSEFHGLRSAPLFNATYEPYIIYKSLTKGEMSLYILAGDEKDAEKLTKFAGNDEQLKKVSAEHGTVAILVWKPTKRSMPIIRALVSGTCSFQRIQKSLDRASRFLPFLNASIVRTGDKPISPPTSTPAPRSASRPALRTATTQVAQVTKSTSRPVGLTKPIVSQARNQQRTTTKSAPPTAKIPPTKPVVMRPTTSKPVINTTRSKPVANKPQTSTTRQPVRPPIKTAMVAPQKKVTSEKSTTSSPNPPLQSQTGENSQAHPSETLDQSIVFIKEVKYDNEFNVVVHPPTPDRETIDTDEEWDRQHEESPASRPSKSPGSQPAESPCSQQKDADKEQSIIDTSAEITNVSETPLPPPQAPENVATIGEMTDLAIRLGNIGLNDSSMVFVNALSGVIAAASPLPNIGVQPGEHVVDTMNRPVSRGQNTSSNNTVHNLMQERSTIHSIDDKGTTEYEKEDPLIDSILEACATESEKVDEETLHQAQREQSITVTEETPLKMIKKEAVTYKGPVVSRPFYFDFVTLPRNDEMKTTIGKLEMREFVHKIRSRNYILASNNIDEQVLESILCGYKLWEDSDLKCSIHPTHNNHAITQFKAKYDESEKKNLEMCLPIENKFLVDATGKKYTVDRISLRDEFD